MIDLGICVFVPYLSDFFFFFTCSWLLLKHYAMKNHVIKQYLKLPFFLLFYFCELGKLKKKVKFVQNKFNRKSL